MKCLKTQLISFLLIINASSIYAQHSDPFTYEIKKVMDNIYLAYRPEPLRFAVEGNVTIIINDEDVVVIESTGTPKGGKQIVNEIKKLTNKPVRYLINTHGHGDHTLGNQEFVKAFPGIEIVAAQPTRDYFLNGQINYVLQYAAEEDFQKKLDYVAGVIKEVEEEKAPGYKVVLENLKQYLEHDIYIRKEEYAKVEFKPPTLVFEKEMVLYRGDREIHLLYIGAGDTPGDVWVYLPKEKLLMTGDAVVNPIPYGYSRNPFEWMETLKKAVEIDFEIMIPGHGEIQYDKKYLELLIELLSVTNNQIKKCVESGMTLEETKASVTVEELEMRFANNDPILKFFFNGYFLEPHVERTYEKLTK